MAPAPGRLRSRARALRHFDIAPMQACFSRWIQWRSRTTPSRRIRLLPHARVFWMFLAQILAGNISCCQTLQQALAWLCLQSSRHASPNTAAYCKARTRLPLSRIHTLRRRLVAQLMASAHGGTDWLGHRVRVVDGSSLSMPDTPPNQKRFPQPERQKPGCGFPVMRIVALFSLSTGALIELAHGALATAERTLFHQLWHHLARGDVLLADRGFTSFADFFVLRQRGIDALMRNHQRRTKNARIVKRLGRRDRLVAWTRTGKAPDWLTPDQWSAMPLEMIVRQIDLIVPVTGFRTRKVVIVTTLLDAKRYRARDLEQLYRRRWQAELYLRDIKTSMGMDVLKCKTPPMVLKEVAMYQIAYNLIRALMLEAAERHGGSSDVISFKGTMDAVSQWAPVMACAQLPQQLESLHEGFLAAIAGMQLPWRPDRSEPRALKRRPKNYQLLNKPRNLFNEIHHRNRYSIALS